MKTVVEQAVDLIGKAKESALARRREAGKRLREILLRNHTPRPGDEQAIVELIDELGIQPEELPGICELVQTLARYEDLLSRENAFQEAARKAHAAIREIDETAKAEHERIDRETREKKAGPENDLHSAEGRLRQVEEARQWIGETRSRWNAVIEQIDLEAARDAEYGSRGIPHGADRVVRFDPPC